MIPTWKVQAVQRLLAEGHMTQRQIAKRLQVWRGIVAGIAQGTRPQGNQPARFAAPDALSWHGPPERCPGCGGLVIMPCLACRTRAQQARRPQHAAGACEFNERLELRLLGMDRSRYEELRARREKVLGLGS
jgi:hypothetical protein